MNLKMTVGGLLCGFFLSFSALAQTASEIQSLVERNIKLTQAEDVEGVLATVHSESPIFASQEGALVHINQNYDLKYEILEFHYIGEDDNFSYARFRLKTTKVAGATFRDNEINALAAFKQEEGVWKFWNQVNLDVKFE